MFILCTLIFANSAKIIIAYSFVKMAKIREPWDDFCYPERYATVI